MYIYIYYTPMQFTTCTRADILLHLTCSDMLTPPPPLPDVWPSMASVRPFSWNWSSSYYHTLHLSFAQLHIVQFLTIFDKSEIVKTMTMTMIILETCGLWDIDYNSDNWELEFMTIFVTWQLRVTLDSICNSCDVYFVVSFQTVLFWTVFFEVYPAYASTKLRGLVIS